MKSKKKKPARKTESSRPKWVPDSFSAYDEVMRAAAVLQKKEARTLGRPTVPRNILWGRVSDITLLFEVNWWNIGWQIECLRNSGEPYKAAEAVRKALEPLRGKHGQDRIALLLRPTSIAATSNDVRRTLNILVAARKKNVALQQSYDAQVESFREAKRAVRETSHKQREGLKREITRRTGVLLQLKNERTANNMAFVTAEKKLSVVNPRKLQTAESELSKARADLEGSKDSIQVEEGIIRDLKQHLRAATKENWLLAREEVKKRLKKLKDIKAGLKEQVAEVGQLEMRYQDQAAGFARQDLLRFLVEKRAHHNPRQLAKAVAGLPEMGCRESFANCEKLAFDREPQTDFQVFELIARAWANRRPGKPQPLIELIRKQINRVPKTALYNGERVSNYLYIYLHCQRQ